MARFLSNLIIAAVLFGINVALCDSAPVPRVIQYEYHHPNGNIYDLYVIRFWQRGTRPDESKEPKGVRLSRDAHSWTLEVFLEHFPQYRDLLTDKGRVDSEVESRMTHIVATDHGRPDRKRGSFSLVLEESGTRKLPIDELYRDSGWVRPTLPLELATPEHPYPFFTRIKDMNVPFTAQVEYHDNGDVFHGGSAQLTEIASPDVSLMPVFRTLIEFEAGEIAKGEKRWTESWKDVAGRAAGELAPSALHRDYPVRHAIRGKRRKNGWAYPAHGFMGKEPFIEPVPELNYGIAVSEWVLYCPQENVDYYRSLGFTRYRGIPRGLRHIPMHASRQAFFNFANRKWKTSEVQRSLFEGKLFDVSFGTPEPLVLLRKDLRLPGLRRRPRKAAPAR